MCSGVQVEVATKYTTVKTLRQQYIFCPQKFKDTFAVYALNELSGSSAIVFVRTCDACRHLSLPLRNLGFGAVSIHGQMSQPKRLAALHKFKAGACRHHTPAPHPQPHIPARTCSPQSTRRPAARGHGRSWRALRACGRVSMRAGVTTLTCMPASTHTALCFA